MATASNIESKGLMDFDVFILCAATTELAQCVKVFAAKQAPEDLERGLHLNSIQVGEFNVTKMRILNKIGQDVMVGVALQSSQGGASTKATISSLRHYIRTKWILMTGMLAGAQ